MFAGLGWPKLFYHWTDYERVSLRFAPYLILLGRLAFSTIARALVAQMRR